MKTYSHYDHLPRTARYLGSEFGDGSMDESLADAIASAIEPVRLRDDDGTYSYFDLGA
jgi:hypothetical protein